ncbi:tektin-2-like [Amphibalanus amphitrite]|uniref:tektin-2-like n=1 Tax=Amphibalanus amphitrite TaxID=1232801 RepID=UPI001C905C60|nr:tektin-2-like [Amphibalanus amphitrite]
MSGLEHKPSARYRPVDWFRHNTHLAEVTRTQLDAGHGARQSAGRAVNEAAIRTAWDQHHSCTRLRDRLSEVEHWKLHLEQSVAAVDDEMAALWRAKTAAEDEREARHFDLETAQAALAQREGRLRLEVVRDDVEETLKQEVDAVSEFRAHLQRRAEQSFEQLCRLADARQALLDDIAAKQGALHVDLSSLALTTESAEIGFKPDPLRVPRDSVTVPRWEDSCREKLAAADYQLQQSRQLRAADADTVVRGQNRLEGCHAAVQFAARRRQHELQQAHDELQWQRGQVSDELAETEHEISRVEAALRDKDPYRRLAETRLERRTERPLTERVYDPPWSALRAETTAVQETQGELRQQLSQLWETAHRLRRHLARLDDNIAGKAAALGVERACAETHGRSRPPPLVRTRSHLDKVLLLKPETVTHDRAATYQVTPELLPGKLTSQECTYGCGCRGTEQ